MNAISFQDVYQTITQRGEFKLGQRAYTPDGRRWVFVTSTTLAKGSIAVPVAVVSTTLWSSSTDGQSRIVYLTRAANALTVGAYEDAIGVIYTGTGANQSFKVRTNNATTVTLYPETALTTALSVADSGVAIISMSNCQKSAITSKIQFAQGIAQVAFTTGDYGWLLTEGDGSVLSSSVLTIGSNFTTGGGTTGQALIGVATNGSFDAQNLGYSIVANSATDTLALVRAQIR